MIILYEFLPILAQIPLILVPPLLAHLLNSYIHLPTKQIYHLIAPCCDRKEFGLLNSLFGNNEFYFVYNKMLGGYDRFVKYLAIQLKLNPYLSVQ